MAEHVGRDTSRGPSEATPPHAYDSPESPDVESPPSPPEEERISSSTDRQPSEIAYSPVEQSVSSTSGQASNDSAEVVNRMSGAVMLLLETNEAGTAGGPASPDPEPHIENQPHSDEPMNLATGQSPDTPPELPRGDEPHLSTAGESASRTTGLARSAGQASQASPETVQAKEEESFQVGSSRNSTKRNVDEEKSDDSNQQFDIEELSPASKSSTDVDFESQSSPIGSSISEEEKMGSESDAGAESSSTPKLGVVIKEEGSSGSGAPESVSLESEISSSKLDASVPGFGIGATGNVGLKSEFLQTDSSLLGSGSGSIEEGGLKSESSPSKTDTAGVEGSSSESSTPKKVRDNVSPKRKSPAKVEHLMAKRSAPFASPDNLQVQSDSSMSTLLEELGIEETRNKPGSSGTTSGLEQNVEMEESEECKREEMEQEGNIEAQEPDSQNEGEVTENVSEMGDSEMENSD